MNKLRDAYQRKIDRADKIEDKVREKSAKLGMKAGRAKTEEAWKRTQNKIGIKRNVAYEKIKNLKSKVGTLSKRAEDYLTSVEKDRQIKKEEMMPNAKPTIPNFYGQ